jgi:hypothetical protein
MVMFEYLKSYRIIIVTGPMRSGTTVCAHMIAKDTGKQYYDDVKDGMGNIYNVRRIVEKENGVIQSPHISWYVDEFGFREDVAIIFMIRNLDEIRTSSERCASFRLWPIGYEDYRRVGVDRLDAIYYHWKNVQKIKIKHSFEILYNDLKTHPFWIEKQFRKIDLWGAKTWELPKTSEV